METIDVKETARRLGIGNEAVRRLAVDGVLTNVRPEQGKQKLFRSFSVREVTALKKVYIKRADKQYLKKRMAELLGPRTNGTNGTGGHPDSYGPNPGDMGDLEPVTKRTPAPTGAAVRPSKGTPAPTGPRGLLARLEAMELLLGALEETMTSQAVQLHDLDRSIQQLLKVWA